MIDASVIQYKLYEENEEFIGITQADLPTLEYITTTVNGSGIAGEIETPLIGQMKAMSITLKHTVLSRKGISLSSPRIHTWELREFQQGIETSGEQKVTNVKHVFKVFPKQMDGGSLKTASTSDPNTVASVLYWAEYRDGEKVMELDPLNNICYVDGVDYLAPLRAAYCS
ncbi:MAG: phage major tail tube protein [Eubacteriales bacterium]|nr:phage major tail tube protein [Eubacteriales bacterium]